MRSRDRFSTWLGRLFGQSEFQARRILEDECALHFLVAWSLFESKCFAGFVKLHQIRQFARRVAVEEHFDTGSLQAAATHFHDRYQDEGRLSNLLHQQACEPFVTILRKPFATLKPEETMFLVVLVAYRFRNNIFHGNKGVESWLRYGEQISLCTSVLQALVSHAENISPTMKTEEAA